MRGCTRIHENSSVNVHKITNVAATVNFGAKKLSINYKKHAIAQREIFATHCNIKR